jgi:integrase
MPKLTDAAVRRFIASATRREIPDSEARGLYLVVQPTGAKSFALRFRRPDGSSGKLTLGPYDPVEAEPSDSPVLGAPLTLAMARQLAASIARQRKRGDDVIEEYRAQKLSRRIAAQRAAANAFGAALVEFFRDHETKWGARPRRWSEDARVLGLSWPRGCDPAEVEPDIISGGLADRWSGKPLAAIDGDSIHLLVDDACRRGIPGLTRRNKGRSRARGRAIHAALSKFFRWCLRRRLVAVNPVGDGPGAPLARERVLTDSEVRWCWLACDRLMPPYGAVIRSLLLTGARLSEVVGMRRDEISDDGATWTLPSERTKNHRPHVLALPPLARETLAGVPRVESAFVFTTSGRRPVTCFSSNKRELDRAMLAVARAERADATVKSWVLHDLRRTAATGMAEIGISPHVVEAVLNHVSGFRAGVAGVYNRAAYGPEKKAALERWAAHIHGLISGEQATVISIAGKTIR